MATKVLGQAAIPATTSTAVYTVPAGKAAIVSTVALCNRGAALLTYRIAVRPAGVALAVEHYIAYDVGLPGNGSDYLTLGITLAATDVLAVYSSLAALSVTVFGDES